MTTAPSSNHDHWETSLGQLHNTPIAVGGKKSKKVEVLQRGVWHEASDFPFMQEQIKSYSMVNFKDTLYLFGKLIFQLLIFNYLIKLKGGFNDNSDPSKIAAKCEKISLGKDLRPDLIWTEVGSLSSAKFGHRSILFGNSIMHVGGYGNGYVIIS